MIAKIPIDVETTETCRECGHSGEPSESNDVRSNLRKYRDEKFRVWRCVGCGTLHCEEVADLAKYYQDYPIRRRSAFDYVLKTWMRVIRKRLVRCGLARTHRILDYGCGNGDLIGYLREQGYEHGRGYDPYVAKFASRDVLAERYDWVIANDVIEHVRSPRDLLREFVDLLEPGGRLCLITPRADGIDLADPERSIHQLHVPCHLHLLSEQALLGMAKGEGLIAERFYRRWFRDSWVPLTSRRCFETFMRLHGNDMDSAFDPPKWKAIATTPSLWFHALFGYWFPPTAEDSMMIIFRKPEDG
jgi:SAM-dependent methyltransferase